MSSSREPEPGKYVSIAANRAAGVQREPSETPRGALSPEVERAARRIHPVVWDEPYRPGEGPMHHAGGPYWRSRLLWLAGKWERDAAAARICAEALPDAREPSESATRWFVWKYVLDLNAECTRVEMPSMSRFLSLQVQDGQPVMWWDVVPDARQITRTFYVVPTGMPGHTLDQRYVGTFQLGAWVGHVFADEPFDGEVPGV